MNDQAHIEEVHDLHEGSWIYLSLGDEGAERGSIQRVVEACEESGWPAVSWSPKPSKANAVDSARYFEGMSHAVRHADAVVVFTNRPSAMTDVELAFAYSHNRPVVAVHVGGQPSASGIQAMLRRHTRARVLECVDFDDCVDALRLALADPQFNATIHEAAREAHEHV